MDKSLGTLLHFWGVFQFTQAQPLPSPHKQCWTLESRIFVRVSTLYRVGGGRTARNFRKGCTVLRGNREMTEEYECCSTVPRTFVQDCGMFQLYLTTDLHYQLLYHSAGRCETVITVETFWCVCWF